MSYCMLYLHTKEATGYPSPDCMRNSGWGQDSSDILFQCRPHGEQWAKSVSLSVSLSVSQSSGSVLLVNDPSLWQGTWILMTDWPIPDDGDRVSDTSDTNSILIQLIAWEDFIKSVLYLVTYNENSLYSKYPSSKTESKPSWNKT